MIEHGNSCRPRQPEVQRQAESALPAAAETAQWQQMKEMARWEYMGRSVRQDPFAPMVLNFDQELGPATYPTVKFETGEIERFLTDQVNKRELHSGEVYWFKYDYGGFSGGVTQCGSHRIMASMQHVLDDNMEVQPKGSRGVKLFRSTGDGAPDLETILDDVRKQFREYFNAPENRDKIPGDISIQYNQIRLNKEKAHPDERDANHRVMVLVNWKTGAEGEGQKVERDLKFIRYLDESQNTIEACKSAKEHVNSELRRFNDEGLRVLSYGADYRFGRVPGMLEGLPQSQFLFAFSTESSLARPPRAFIDIGATFGSGGGTDVDLGWASEAPNRSLARHSQLNVKDYTHQMIWGNILEQGNTVGARSVFSILYEGPARGNTGMLAANLKFSHWIYTHATGPFVFSGDEESLVANGKMLDKEQTLASEGYTIRQNRLQYDWSGYAEVTHQTGRYLGMVLAERQAT